MQEGEDHLIAYVDTRLLQDYLGHRNIQHTVRYTASNAARFKGGREKPC
ncbi:hypothetical protein EHR28_24145 [Escherichia coli]|nr:hypothetical protein [Escherichia coli]EEY7915028.1 hypothetical protein [Escherichia coli O21:H28]EHX75149.1 type 1 fimbriae regulatory FimB domain protein [Escherichia coli DEC14A]EEY0083124.1 hypothetical protein [Escherichia coli]EEY0085851.1 hypothetical protein [Escherichia coli]